VSATTRETRVPAGRNGAQLTTAGRRPTVTDVAARAGVSTSTASRALSDKDPASPGVRRRVREAATQLGYIPDLNARSLRAGTRKEVGVLVSNLRDSFYADLATGIEAALSAAGYSIILAMDNADETRELAAVDTFAALRVPGVIMTAVSPAAVRKLTRTGIRVVQADRVVVDGQADAVLSGNRAGAAAATAHLLDHGHRRIALLIDEVKWTTGAGRLEGFRQAHQEYGVPVDESLVVFVSADQTAARAEVGRLLDAVPDLTAIFAANSVLAEAAFIEAQSRGLRLPEQLSLVGYDDVRWMTMVRPALTTVSQHADEIGRCCADLLIRRLRDDTEGRPISMYIDPTLIVRDSVHRLNAATGH